jgi:ribulose-5-phosphate 4-epimerase/fuculose-1-phosphate aldolase
VAWDVKIRWADHDAARCPFFPAVRLMRETSGEVAAIRRDLVTANQILAHQGVVDGFGHVSARHPDRPEYFLLSRRMPPEMVSDDDLLEFDEESQLVSPGDPPIFLERFIHGEIYRIRPDVQAVVHSHSDAIIPLGVTSTPLRAVFHMGAFLGTSTPVFEIRDACGDGSNMLVCDHALGRALAEKLGRGSAILMRGHGSTVVGPSLRHAVVQAVYAEINARLQSQAMLLGPVNYLTEGETRAAAATNAGQLGRAWDLWATQARRALGIATVTAV